MIAYNMKPILLLRGGVIGSIYVINYWSISLIYLLYPAMRLSKAKLMQGKYPSWLLQKLLADKYHQHLQ